MGAPFSGDADGALNEASALSEDTFDATRDAALVERAQVGDAAAFEALITPILPRALRLARRLLEDEQDAEDLVQDACLRALDRIEQHDRTRAFGPWFLRLLTNLGLNQQRSRQVRRHEAVSDYTPSTSATPDVEMERLEIQERFERAVAGLSKRQREIIMLHEVEGWTTADIGEALELSPQTVRWHLHDARHTLRGTLKELRDVADRTNNEDV